MSRHQTHHTLNVPLPRHNYVYKQDDIEQIKSQLIFTDDDYLQHLGFECDEKSIIDPTQKLKKNLKSKSKSKLKSKEKSSPSSFFSIIDKLLITNISK